MAYHLINIKITKGSDGDATITAEVAADAMSAYRVHAIDQLGKNIKVPGFRAGHIPANVVVKTVGEATIMQEAAEIAMTEQYPQLIKEEKLSIIGQPNVSITDMGEGKGMAFSITATLLPEITLPDYKKIAAKHLGKRTEQTVTDNEVTETLTHLRRERAKIEKIESGSTPETATKETAEMDTLALPPIDDTFTKTLGYDSAEVFTEKLKENIKNEKANREYEKARIATIEELIKEANIKVPTSLIQTELENMESQFAHDLAHAGQTLDQYLADTKKKKDDLHKEWEGGAKKRAAMQLLMREIAIKEEITPDPNQVQQEVDHIVSHTKDANPDSVRNYVAAGLRTELVFRFLESIAKEEK